MIESLRRRCDDLSEALSRSQIRGSDAIRDRLRLIDAMPVGLFEVGPGGEILEANTQFLRLFGIDRESCLGHPLREIAPDVAHAVMDAVREGTNHESAWTKDLRIDAASPTASDTGFSETPRRTLLIRLHTGGRIDGDGRSVVCSVADVTGQSPSAAGEPGDDSLYREACAAAFDVVWDWDLENDRIRWSGDTERILGCRAEDAGESVEWWIDRIHPEDRDRAWTRLIDVVAGGGRSRRDEYRLVVDRDRFIWVEDRGRLVASADGRRRRMVGGLTEVTSRHDLSDQRRALEARVRGAKSAIGEGQIEIVRGKDVVTLSPTLLRILGHTEAAESVSIDAATFESLIHAEERARVVATLRGAMERDLIVDEEFRIRSRRGLYVWLHLRGCSESAIEGGERVFTGLVTDITDRRRELRLMRQTEQTALIGGWELDLTTMEVFWTAETYRIHEVDPETFAPTLERAVEFYAPECRERISSAVRDSMMSGASWDLELDIITAKGRRVSVRAVGRTEMEDGRAVRAFGAFQDITERKKLETQLLQANKLESIGRLAGGVAHDFNNWMTAVLGYSDLAMAQIEAGSPVHDALTNIRGAAERAAGLTKQLLALARRQPLLAKVVDAGDLIRRMHPLMHGVVVAGIELRLDLAPEPMPLLIDPSQFEQVLLNLVVNARDATPPGGVITIAASRCSGSAVPRALSSHGPSSDHLMVSVTDTGRGIEPAARAHLFEPFFTTKEMGKGTGLGLATCYGIVRQSGGQIFVESEVGEGTRFTMYFPLQRVAGGDRLG